MSRLAFLLVIGFGVTALAKGPTRLVLDDQHLQLELAYAPGRKVENYRVAETDSIILDARKYKLRLPEEVALADVNCVQVVVNREEQYTAPWKNGMATLDAATLVPNSAGAPRFVRFRAGTRVIVAVGACSKPASFGVIWAGMIDVESATTKGSTRLVLDNQHLDQHVGEPGASVSVTDNYVIGETDSITLDGRKHDLRLPEWVKRADLNCVQVTVGGEEVYRAAWNKKTSSATLDPTTLVPKSAGTPKLVRFRAGMLVAVDVGVCAKNDGRFMPAWETAIEIK